MHGCLKKLMLAIPLIAATAAIVTAGVPATPDARSDATGAGNPLGVHASAGTGPSLTAKLTDLGAGWVRINDNLDGLRNDNLKGVLDAGVNLEITVSNHDPSNIDTTYGSVERWPNAGFPFKSKDAYQARIRDLLTPLLPSLTGGRQLWVQAENEIQDVSFRPRSRFWRGTTDQYLAQLQALHETVKSLDPSIPVVLAGFPSEALDAVLDPSDRSYDFQTEFQGRLLSEGLYDAADLHFYGCVEDIPAKVEWVKAHMPAGKRWISTENGGPDSRCPATPISWYQDPSQFEQLQAAQVPLRLDACADNGGSICLWFSLFDLNDETGVFNHLGLIAHGAGGPPLAKPAYDAFKDAVYAYTHQVPLPTPTGPALPPDTTGSVPDPDAGARIEVLSHSVKLTRRDVAKVLLECRADTNQRCEGRLGLTTAQLVRTDGHRRAVALGSRSFSISGNTSAAVELRLPKANLRLARRAMGLRIEATATTHDRAGNFAASKRIVLSGPRP